MTFVLSRFCIGHLFFWTWKRHSFSYPLNTSKLIFIAILQITETDSKGKILIFLRRKSAIFCDFLWFSFSTQFFSDHKSELFKKRWQLHLDNEYSWKNRFNRFHATLNGKLYLLYSLCIYIYLCLSYIHWLYYIWISLFSSDLNLFSENAAIIKELSTWATIAPPPSTLDVKDYTNSCPNLYTYNYTFMYNYTISLCSWSWSWPFQDSCLDKDSNCLQNMFYKSNSKHFGMFCSTFKHLPYLCLL